MESAHASIASVYTTNFERAMRFAKSLEAGAVGVNCSAPTQVSEYNTLVCLWI